MSNRSLTISSDNLINNLYISNFLNTAGQSFTKVIPVSTPETLVPDSDDFTTIFKLSPSDSGSLIIISDLITFTPTTSQNIRLPPCKDSVGCKFSFLVTSRNATSVYINPISSDFISGSINFVQAGPTQITANKFRTQISRVAHNAPFGTFVQYWCIGENDWICYNNTTSGAAPFV